MNVILASASPRRQELLKRIFDEFEILPADIDETIPDDIGSEFAPVFLAAEKASAIAKNHPDSLIISADTIVLIDDKILGKPCNDQEAVDMLHLLSGKTHKVITGCCIKLDGECISFSEESLVSFYKLDDDEIKAYVASGATVGKAGAYGIQDEGALFVEKIDGDYYNIVGLPIAKLNREIKYLLSNH